MALPDEVREKISTVFTGGCAERNLCPVKDIIATFSDKWSMYAVLLLGEYTRMRFGELRASIKGISQRMLTVTLRSLEKDGIVLRTVYSEIPPRVEYELTALGESLVTQLLLMASWAEENFTEILKARKKYEKLNA